MDLVEPHGASKCASEVRSKHEIKYMQLHFQVSEYSPFYRSLIGDKAGDQTNEPLPANE